MGALGEGLSRYYKQGYCSFHTPGHKGQQEFFNNIKFPEFDLTELPGLDMLHSPRGIIAEAMKHAADTFGAEETFFLINGGTVGNQAMFLTLENITEKTVIVERSSHRSVMSGLILSGLKPNYMIPVVHPEFNLPLGLDIGEQTTKSWHEAAACHVTYPSYYGTVCDMDSLVKRVHMDFNMPLLVDQAHGSHFLNPLFPPSALKLGADLVLNSVHKTLSALTQSAMLHVQGDRISRTRLRESLDLLQSSSPSYLLMASLERACEFAGDLWRWEHLKEAVDDLHRRLGKDLRILSSADAKTYGIHEVDWSKILINTSSLGVSAPRCVEYLRANFGIQPELWDQETILFLLGIGNKPEDVYRLTKGLECLRDFSSSLEGYKRRGVRRSLGSTKAPLPRCVLSPREAFMAPKRKIPLKESLGKIVGETISPYPPGIPLIVMGEEMTYEIMKILLTAEERRWQGWEDFEQQMISIVEVI